MENYGLTEKEVDLILRLNGAVKEVGYGTCTSIYHKGQLMDVQPAPRYRIIDGEVIKSDAEGTTHASAKGEAKWVGDSASTITP